MTADYRDIKVDSTSVGSDNQVSGFIGLDTMFLSITNNGTIEYNTLLNANLTYSQNPSITLDYVINDFFK